VLCADGRRTVNLPPRARVEVVGGRTPLRLIRLRPGPFTDRLVEKFELPVQGWRGPSTG
jgi:NAD+ kinase